jgi:hypothetical protein
MPDASAPVLLLTAWHLPHMWLMPRHMLALRRLERGACWSQPGLVRSHRWSSRRSLLMTSWWESREAAEAWLACDALQRFDARIRSVKGAESWVELR